MKISRSNLAVSATALACAGVFGGVFAVALVGQQPSRDETTVVRSVSDEAGAEATPSGQASAAVAATPSATASAVAAAVDPAQTSSTTSRSQTVTEPDPTTQPAPTEPAPADPAPVDPAPTEPAPTQPAPEPVAPPANSGGTAGPPVGNTPPPGPTEYPCLPQEYGINPNCPLPAPASTS